VRTDPKPRFPFPIPNGWFAVAFGDELAPGALKPLHYFGRELVLFRSEQGAAYELDAYCPHLGAHLGCGGRVEADTVVCPFHAWRWDGAGVCRQIPNAKRIPPTARMRAWPVLEHSGAVFVWHDESGAGPSFELPPHPELSDADWVPVERHEFTIATCAQEVAENAHDPAHFTAVHGIRATSYGLGVGHLRTRGLADMAQLLLQTPIDEERLHVRWQFATPRAAEGGPLPLGVAFAREFVRQFGQDIPIWESKRYLPRPLLCEGDGAMAGFRRWATQFYPQSGSAPAP
jgi:phenylpropionate dioxygenase-like ring-hydroxylating dioxygenase large terminal subunit